MFKKFIIFLIIIFSTSLSFSEIQGKIRGGISPNMPTPITWYRMDDDTTSTNVVDVMNYSNGTARQNTSILHTAGKINGALTFNGSTDYINTNATFQSIFQDSFSMSVWIKMTDGNPSTETFMFYVAKQAQNPNQASFSVLSDGALEFVYIANGGGDALNVRTSDGPMHNGQEDWHMITVVAKNIGTGVTLSAYFDSIFVNSLVVTVSDMSKFSVTDNALIGKVDTTFLNGSIDNFMIFNKALTQEEIEYLYNNQGGLRGKIR